MKEKKNEIICRIIGVLLIIAFWFLLSSILGVYKIPSPLKIFPEFFNILFSSTRIKMQGGGSHGIGIHLLYTIEMTLAGSFIGIILGIGSGVIFGMIDKLKKLSETPIEALRTIPPLAVTPFFIMWFGPNMVAQLVILIFYSFTMLVINTLTAINNLNPIYTNFAYTLGANKRQINRTVVIPGVIPEVVGGIRVVLGVSWGIQIVSELMGSPKGLGQIFSMCISIQALDIIIIGIIWIAIIAYIFDLIFVNLIKILIKWMPKNVIR